MFISYVFLFRAESSTVRIYRPGSRKALLATEIIVHWLRKTQMKQGLIKGIRKGGKN